MTSYSSLIDLLPHPLRTGTRLYRPLPHTTKIDFQSILTSENQHSTPTAPTVLGPEPRNTCPSPKPETGLRHPLSTSQKSSLLHQSKKFSDVPRLTSYLTTPQLIPSALRSPLRGRHPTTLYSHRTGPSAVRLPLTLTTLPPHRSPRGQRTGPTPYTTTTTSSTLPTSLVPTSLPPRDQTYTTTVTHPCSPPSPDFPSTRPPGRPDTRLTSSGTHGTHPLSDRGRDPVEECRRVVGGTGRDLKGTERAPVSRTRVPEGGSPRLTEDLRPGNPDFAGDGGRTHWW